MNKARRQLGHYCINPRTGSFNSNVSSQTLVM